MIPIKKLETIKTVYSHAACPDGTVAALICSETLNRLGIEHEVRTIQYQSKEHRELVPKPGQLFADITPPIERHKEWAEHSPIILDHHGTAKHVVEALGGIYGEDEKVCGSLLCYTYIYEPHVGSNDEWEYYAHLSMVRDTWKTKHDDWEKACAFARGLAWYGTRDLLDLMNNGKLDLSAVLAFGVKENKRVLRRTELLAKNGYILEFSLKNKKYRVLFVNATEKIASEIGEYARGEMDVDLAVTWFTTCQDGSPYTICSLRSNERVSAVKIAELNNGGGHERAAGFRINGGFNLSLCDLVHHVRYSLQRTH